MSLFGDFDLLQFGTALKVAVASFGKVDPPKGYTALKMADLGVDGHGTTFDSRSGRAHAIVVEQGDELIVGIRGTDHFNDIKDYDNISQSKSYFKQFQPLLKAVADYARENDSHVTFTGISLGAAAVNIIADRASHRWGHTFQHSDFIGISSPFLSRNRQADVYNFGFSNDAVYHVVPGTWTHGTRMNATKHVFLYENRRFLHGDNLDDRLSVHGVGNVIDAIKSIGGLTIEGGGLLVDTLTAHSYVIFDDTSQIVRTGQLRHPGNSVLTVIGEGRDDKLYGAAADKPGGHNEWFFGRGGDDKIKAHAGNDQLYGGSGNDLLSGGDGVDFMAGGSGRDTLILETHRDRAEGGIGADKFIVKDILPHNDAGRPQPAGNNPATVFIMDFEPGSETLNLRAIDGNLGRRGDQPLHFADTAYVVYDGSDGLSQLERGYVDDLRPGSVTIYLDQAGDTHVIVNRDGDRVRELDIILTGNIGDISGDILL